MEPLAGLTFGSSKRLPVFLQTEAAECGLASLGMIACFHGHRIDLAGLRRRFTVSLKGATLAYLMQAAGRLHMAPRPLRLELEELPQLRTPCILHWDMNHFVVLRSADARGALIHDPAFGMRRMALAEVSKHFTGIALELAEAMHDARALGVAYFQASVLAERDGHWVLARTYAEKAKVQYEELSDRANVGRLLNNLGGLEFLLGKPEQAVDHLKHSFAVALELGHEEEAATAISSLAQVHLRTGDVVRAEEQALHALELIGDRKNMINEVGNARLVLGRALLEQDRLDEAEVAFAEADDAFAKLSSGSHRAAAWIAQGDLATKRGDERRAAVLFRRAAETLQDFRF